MFVRVQFSTCYLARRRPEAGAWPEVPCLASLRPGLGGTQWPHWASPTGFNYSYIQLLASNTLLLLLLHSTVSTTWPHRHLLASPLATAICLPFWPKPANGLRVRVAWEKTVKWPKGHSDYQCYSEVARRRMCQLSHTTYEAVSIVSLGR